MALNGGTMNDEQGSVTAPSHGVIAGVDGVVDNAVGGGEVPGGRSTPEALEEGAPGAFREPTDPAVAVVDRDPLTLLTEEIVALRAEVAATGHARAADQDRAAARELVIAHQREELDQLRAERRGTGLRPLVVALQRLRADLLAEEVRADPSPASAALFASFADSVADVLERAGCHRVPAVEGEEFVAGQHQIVRTEPGPNEAHGRVLIVLAEGWAETDTGRVLAPARVVVGRRAPDTGTSGGTTGDCAAPDPRIDQEPQEAGA